MLSHLPFQVGDEFTDAKGNTAIHALYGSGLFRDVRLERDGDVLVVQVQERSARRVSARLTIPPLNRACEMSA